MAKEPLPDLSIVLTFLRLAQGWTQAELARAAGISPGLLNEYERGRKPLSRGRMELLVSVLGLPPKAIEAALAHLASVRALGRAPEGPEDEARRHIEAVAERGGRIVADCARAVLTLFTREGEALQARQQAGQLWERLQRRAPRERLTLVEASRKFRGWALCEKVAAESIAAAPNHPRQALELAELALRVAELTPGPKHWSWRLQGYAWAHVSNARRVCNDLPAAEEAMQRAKKLWEAGAPGDLEFLNEAWLPGLEAALRREQRRFPEALRKVDEALASSPGAIRAQVLVAKSGILEALGDPQGSTAVLQEAAFLIREPRLAFGVRFNLLVDLCRLGRADEAESELPEIRRMAERLGEELDLVRVVWLEGSVAAGLRRTAEAHAAFQQARREFHIRGLPYDYALVSLEMALLQLEQGRTAEVRGLTEEMLWIFRAQGIHREALAALQIFNDAARKEIATVELVQRVAAYLHRAQHDPELRFEESGY